jgi:hypothetical protein
MRSPGPAELDKWRVSHTTALADPEDARAGPQATRASAKRIKELEHDLLRKGPSAGRDDRAAGSIKKSLGDQQTRVRDE